MSFREAFISVSQNWYLTLSDWNPDRQRLQFNIFATNSKHVGLCRVVTWKTYFIVDLGIFEKFPRSLPCFLPPRNNDLATRK